MTRTQANPSQRQTQTAPPQQAPANGDSQKDNAKLLDELLGKTTEYTPLAEGAPIKLSVTMVKQYLCVPTKSGKMPADSDVIKFMTMCKQRALNPWAGDCYLLGYDSQDGPKFSIVVAIQALFKRAEINAQFDGIESGVVVCRGDGAEMEVIERAGDMTLPGETLLGGWAKVFRKDRSKCFYQRLKIGTYRKKTPIWNQDPEGMITKCCESGALRQAFPSEVGGLYLHEELMDTARAVEEEKRKQETVSAAQALKDRMLPPKPPAEEVVGKATGLPPQDEHQDQDATQTRQEAPGEHSQDTAPEGREPGSDDPEPAGEAPGAPGAVESPASQPVMFGGR